jgi:acetolactate synthase-1/2/3 large subunit
MIAISSSPSERASTTAWPGVPAKFARNAKRIAHFDVDRAEVNKVKRVQWSHVGLLTEALQALIAHGRREKFKRDYTRGMRTWRAEARARDELRPRQQAHPAVLRDRRDQQAHRGEAIITTGVGQHQMWAAQYCDFRHPRLWLTSGSMGTMGFGLPAAIGAQIANPRRLVIDIDGDSSIRMNIGELETVTTYDLPVKVVVLNNTATAW